MDKEKNMLGIKFDSGCIKILVTYKENFTRISENKETP